MRPASSTNLSEGTESFFGYRMVEPSLPVMEERLQGFFRCVYDEVVVRIISILRGCFVHRF